MRRRRKKNPLLTRIIVVSVAAHAIILPVAAHFGAFQKVQKAFGSSTVVVINTPPVEEKKAEKAKKTETKPQKTQPKRSSAEVRRSGQSSKPNPDAPKVIVGTGTGDGAGATADPNATGKAGALPTNPTPPPSAGTGNGERNTTPPTPPTEPTVKPKPIVTLPSTPVEPKPVPEPKVKKFVQVETTYAPEPVIPDDLRAQPLDKTTVVEADVNPDGMPENVKVAESSGLKELDDIGLGTAKKYKFKAATLGDEPVVGHVRFRIIFKVE